MRRTAKVAVAISALLLLSMALGVTLASAVAPTVSIDAPASIAYTSAHLSGKVDPEDTDTYYYFQYSADPGVDGWSQTSFQGPLAANSGEVSVSEDLTGIKPGTQYFARLVASNFSDPDVISAEETFTTEAVALPTVTISAPSAITGSSAHFSGTIDPNAPESAPASDAVEAGFKVNWHFECTPECPGLAGGTISADNTTHTVEAGASGLQPNTDYQVTLVAKNAGPPASAGPEAFKTSKVAPRAETLQAGVLASDQAILRGSVNPGNSPVTYQFQWGPTTAYGNSAPANPATIGVEDNATHVVSAPIAGLSPATQYHFRVVVTNTDTSVVSTSTDRTFTTAAVPTTPPSCSNDVFRIGFSSLLGECRAYEQVSPTNKRNGDVESVNTTQTTASGDAAIFPSTAAFPGAETSVPLAYNRSLRGLSQWSTIGLEAAQINVGRQIIIASPATSADLSRTLQLSLEALTPDAVPGNGNVYLQDNTTGDRKLLLTGPESLYYQSAGPGGKTFRGATPDLSRILFSSTEKLTPTAAEGDANLYELTDEGQLSVVNVLPGGAPAANSDVRVPYGGRAISEDGSRIVFESPAAPAGPTPLYLEENDGTSKAISVSQRAGDSDEPKPAKFLTISADGSSVFFNARDPLTDDSTSDGGTNSSDLYRFDVDTGLLEDLTIPLEPGGEGTEGGNVEFSPLVAVSPSGDRVFYVGKHVMAPGARNGFGNIYEWHDGETNLVATLDPGVSGPEGFGPSSYSLSPSGTHFSFASYTPLTGYDNHSPNCEELIAQGGPAGICREVFTYDSGTKELKCVSCNPVAQALGHSELGDDAWTVSDYRNRSTLDDGRVFFESKDKLAPGDTNGAVDVYMWDEGVVSLVSPGTAATDATFKDASVDGANVFLTTAQRLVPQDIDGNVDLYDARVGGGLAAQMVNPELEPPACAGESCRGLAAGASLGPLPATNSFEGPPSAVTSRKRCPKVRKGSVSKAKNSKAKCPQTQRKKKKKATKGGAKRSGGANSRSAK